LHTGPLIPTHYIAQISDHMDQRKLDSQAWLAASHLNKDLLHQPGLLIEYQQFKQLILTAVEGCEQADIGICIGKKLSITSHGTLGFALLNCASLRQAIELCQRYIGIRTPLLDLSFRQNQNSFVIEINELFHIQSIRRFFIESLLVTLQQSLSFVAGHNKLFKRLEFNFPQPSYWPMYQDIFDCEVHFSATKSRVFVDPILLDMPLSGRDPHSFRQAELLCKAELEKLTSISRLAGQVHLLLEMSAPQDRKLQLVADKLYLTPRTLHRHLVAEKTCFKMLLEQVNHQQAKVLFKQGESVQSVAYALGYTESANFRRAFKRWEGKTPQNFVNLLRNPNLI
jgi:AraC-like DNA-binding protein